jgi:predicted  nucleic acid-binding Zn-ribbon protein
MDEIPLTELPNYWQQHIQHLRQERAKLRSGLASPKAGRIIRGLRHDLAKMRIQRNEARAELAALRAERS